jgi:hypothetical protein
VVGAGQAGLPNGIPPHAGRRSCLALDAGERVGDDPTDPRFQPRKRASLEGTWYPTEYSKLRVQYAYDDRTGFSNASSVWLQFEFLLGAHAAHKF